MDISKVKPDLDVKIPADPSLKGSAAHPKPPAEEEKTAAERARRVGAADISAVTSPFDIIGRVDDEALYIKRRP